VLKRASSWKATKLQSKGVKAMNQARIRDAAISLFFAFETTLTKERAANYSARRGQSGCDIGG